MSTLRFLRTQYRLYLRAGFGPRMAAKCAVRSYFTGF